MDGKPTIKIMSKIELLQTLKLHNSESNKNICITKRIMSSKRGSTPLMSTTNSTKNKSKQSITNRKIQTNNFTSPNSNLFSIASCRRLSECKTVMGLRTFKKENIIKVTDSQRLLLKSSDKILKMCWDQPTQYLPPLIISADFIMDQDDFWSEPKINPNINQTWKHLHNKFFVIWMVKIQKGYKILADYAQKWCLPLNAVYFHRRKSRLTVDYTPIKKQLIKVYGELRQQIRVVQCLKINTKNIIEVGSFVGRIPLTLDNRFKTCYIRTQYSGQGLQKIMEICRVSMFDRSSKIQKLHLIHQFISKFYQEIEQQKCQTNLLLLKGTIAQNRQTFFVDEQAAQQEVEIFKKSLVDKMLRQKGRGFQIDGFSINYLVGDIVKRNYNLLIGTAIERLKSKNRKLQSSFNGKPASLSSQVEIQETFYQYLL